MLKRQSIITEDPTYINKSSTTPVPQKTKSIFDADEEKSKVNENIFLKILFKKKVFFKDASTFIKKSKT
jgi:hypothetical protein